MKYNQHEFSISARDLFLMLLAFEDSPTNLVKHAEPSDRSSMITWDLEVHQVYLYPHTSLPALGRVNRVEFDRSTFYNVSFPENTIFYDCDFNSVTFDSCDLSNVTFRDCILSHVEFKNCDLIGMQIEGATDKRSGMSFEECTGVVFYSYGQNISTSDRTVLVLESKDGSLVFHIGCQHLSYDEMKRHIEEERGYDHPYLKIIALANSLQGLEMWEEDEDLDDDDDDFDDNDGSEEEDEDE